jgi:hypothetical protein
MPPIPNIALVLLAVLYGTSQGADLADSKREVKPEVVTSWSIIFHYPKDGPLSKFADERSARPCTALGLRADFPVGRNVGVFVDEIVRHAYLGFSHHGKKAAFSWEQLSGIPSMTHALLLGGTP